jgi:hypothetical protein
MKTVQQAGLSHEFGGQNIPCLVTGLAERAKAKASFRENGVVMAAARGGT